MLTDSRAFVNTFSVATVPTVYGIETLWCKFFICLDAAVATVPTVYGIETCRKQPNIRVEFLWLQQYLPFTVLKQVNPPAKPYTA